MIIKPENLSVHEPDEDLLEIINNKTFNDKVLFKTNSDFHSIQVVENEIGRFLHYKDTYQAGYIDTPFYKGNIPYINYFLIPYLINDKIKNILLIGLGSGILVNQYETLFQNLKNIDVIDIEENILYIAEKYFNFRPSEKFNFILQDGLVYLNNTKKKYDLIVADVGSDSGIDDRFCSEEYLRTVKNRLKKNGIFVSNMPSAADVLNPKNSFVTGLIGKYKTVFQNLHLYKGNTSDRIYYKSFFNLDERVIDITNLIFIASDNTLKIKNKTYEIEKLGIKIQDYLKDLIVV